MREDLILAAYAVAQGFTLHGHTNDAVHFTEGVPNDALVFKKKNVSVWLTVRGWRVVRLIDCHYEKPTDDQFFKKLYPALEKAYMLALEESK